MGFDLASTEEMTGAIFTGAGGSMPFWYTMIGAAILVYTIWSGNRHEHAAYKKMQK